MNGKILVTAILTFALIMGAAIYYLQLYAFYDPEPEDTVMRLTNTQTGQPEDIATNDFQGIDATSSPLRFRSCFTTPAGIAQLAETYTPYPDATPLTAPGWFDCFDAVRIGRALEAGDATAFLSERDIRDGVDRVIAVFPDGRAFAWHQLNEKYSE